MSEVPSGTATFLFSDVEGSTRLLKKLREGYGDVLAQHQRILREAFAAHGGEEVDTQGDSFFAAFRRAQDAVLAAGEAQRALAEHEWPEGGELRVRMGIHTGQVAVAGNRYLGVAVHRAARICAAGHGGQVLVSQTTKGLLDDEEVELPGLEFRDLGEQRLKDLDRPIRLFQLIGPGLPDEFPPLSTLDQVPARGLTPFAGREKELAEATVAALRRRSWPVRKLAIAAAALVLIVPPLAYVLATQLGGGSSPKGVAVAANSVAVIDPETNAVVGDITVGRGPAQLAYANGNVWVVNSRDSTLSRISARTLEASPPVGVSTAEVTDLSVGHGSVWLAAGDVVRFDPAANRVGDVIAMPRLKGSGTAPSYVHAVAVDGRGVWALDEAQAAAFRIDPQLKTVSVRVPGAISGAILERGAGIFGDPDRMAPGHGRLWVIDAGATAVNEVNPSLRSVVASVSLPPAATITTRLDPTALAVGEGAVWLTSYVKGQLWRVDPNTASLSKTIPVGRGAQGVAVGEGGIWVANGVDGTVSRVDPDTNEVVATIEVGHLPSWIAVGGGRIWVSVQP